MSNSKVRIEGTIENESCATKRGEQNLLLNPIKPKFKCQNWRNHKKWKMLNFISRQQNIEPKNSPLWPEKREKDPKIHKTWASTNSYKQVGAELGQAQPSWSEALCQLSIWVIFLSTSTIIQVNFIENRLKWPRLK